MRLLTTPSTALPDQEHVSLKSLQESGGASIVEVEGGHFPPVSEEEGQRPGGEGTAKDISGTIVGKGIVGVHTTNFLVLEVEICGTIYTCTCTCMWQSQVENKHQ